MAGVTNPWASRREALTSEGFFGRAPVTHEVNSAYVHGMNEKIEKNRIAVDRMNALLNQTAGNDDLSAAQVNIKKAVEVLSALSINMGHAIAQTNISLKSSAQQANKPTEVAAQEIDSAPSP